MKIFHFFLITAVCGLAAAELDLKQLCLNKTLNEVVSHPNDCRGYIECSEQPAVYFCELGLHFDIKRLVCNWPENVDCQLASQAKNDVKDTVKPVFTALTAIDIMTGEVVDPMFGYDRLNVVCRHFGAYFLPNPKQCRAYYLCAYGHMHEHACGANTLWDYKAQQCVLSHKANCYQLNEEEENEINQYLGINVNSTTTEIVFLTTTPIPLPPIVVQPSKKPNLSNTYNVVCPSRRQSYVAHPNDCNKYFICILGTPVMTSCPKGLLWDSNKEYCDLSKNVKCFAEKSP